MFRLRHAALAGSSSMAEQRSSASAGGILPMGSSSRRLFEPSRLIPCSPSWTRSAGSPRPQDRLLPPRVRIVRRFRSKSSQSYAARYQDVHQGTARPTSLPSCVNNGRIRPFTSRSDDAQSSNVVSINAPVIHDLQIMVTQGFERSKNSATVRLGRLSGRRCRRDAGTVCVRLATEDDQAIKPEFRRELDISGTMQGASHRNSQVRADPPISLDRGLQRPPARVLNRTGF